MRDWVMSWRLRAREAGRRKSSIKSHGRSSGVYADTYEALILAGLGEKEQAFKLLYEAADHREGPMALYKLDPMFDGLRTDPRSDDLLRRMNLPGTIQTAAGPAKVAGEGLRTSRPHVRPAV